MHEMSIAPAILDLARRHVPKGAALRTVRVCAGPLRAIDQQSMQWAWQALMEEQSAGPITLELTILPWNLRCTTCGAEWESVDAIGRCSCGSTEVLPTGSDRLQLVSIEVDDVETPMSLHEGSSPCRSR
ncbi:MAG: hydrogenase maturation nickel metallochaperone HypA [Tepidisphaeraceae bacterium]|jgi:hydrogenase nickel incorporation protein HypA/HybF